MRLHELHPHAMHVMHDPLRTMDPTHSQCWQYPLFLASCAQLLTFDGGTFRA